MVKSVFDMSDYSRIPATLVLEDGTHFRGYAFGARGEVTAEIIFHTGMTGYQEVITDPSYSGQMVVMTYPQIGNYGINDLDSESAKPHVTAFIIKELSGVASNWRSEHDLSKYLHDAGVMGLEGIDTRSLVLHLRSRGAMRAVISTERHDPGILKQVALDSPTMEGQNLVYKVSSKSPYVYATDQRLAGLYESIGHFPANVESERKRIVAYDFGAKANILTLLREQNFEVQVVPATATAEDVLRYEPDGVFLSNGPGDPAALPEIVGNVRKLLGKTPMFGICLGHQILGLANDAKTYKLKFGHHGANHPVKDLLTDKVEITSQNHGFCVDADTLPSSSKITHINLNDQTLEGFEDRDRKFFCVQYHPEAAPGPHDSTYLFERFREWVERG